MTLEGRQSSRFRGAHLVWKTHYWKCPPIVPERRRRKRKQRSSDPLTSPLQDQEAEQKNKGVLLFILYDCMPPDSEGHYGCSWDTFLTLQQPCGCSSSRFSLPSFHTGSIFIWLWLNNTIREREKSHSNTSRLKLQLDSNRNNKLQFSRWLLRDLE
jgi:hypothetical protein